MFPDHTLFSFIFFMNDTVYRMVKEGFYRRNVLFFSWLSNVVILSNTFLKSLFSRHLRGELTQWKCLENNDTVYFTSCVTETNCREQMNLNTPRSYEADQIYLFYYIRTKKIEKNIGFDGWVPYAIIALLFQKRKKIY